MSNEPRPVRISGIIRQTDGTESHFQIVKDTGWQQWGQPDSVLGRNVDLLEALFAAAAEHMGDVDDELDEDEDDHPEHDECADGCGLDINHDGACLDKPGGRVVCSHEELRAPYLHIEGQGHRHHFEGQTLVHSHEGGDVAHGYYEHPEDGQ